ncbi:hypothetical protein [Natrinema pellirubrum]|uniref:hypothetical protein n=1 Tax=Natrinema pellirubrum TaxID=69525 RepID=UPI0012FC2D2C|nr:hypothetical protein [Natrinema pellirubrum]
MEDGETIPEDVKADLKEVIDEAARCELPRCSREFGIGVVVVDAELGQCDCDQEILLSFSERRRRWPRLRI